MYTVLVRAVLEPTLPHIWASDTQIVEVSYLGLSPEGICKGAQCAKKQFLKKLILMIRLWDLGPPQFVFLGYVLFI